MTCERGAVEEEVLRLLRPTRAQIGLLARFYNRLKRVLEPCLRGRGLNASVEVHGSFAKGTLLSDKWELDVFVVFEGVDKEWINRSSEASLRECLSPHFPVMARYSQHPYVTVSYMGLQADVVPIIRAPKPGSTGLGVERTPFHTSYVRKALEEEPCLADEVRLLKSFLKGIGVYGSESHIRGFSGYVAELLVIRYGGFRGVIEAASRWRPPVVLAGGGLAGSLAKRYPDSPIILPDPVDPERNAAASVSLRSLATLILAARLYSMRPSRHYFHLWQARPRPRLLPAVIVECRGSFYLAPKDAVWGRLARTARWLSGRLGSMGFRVLSHSFDTDESTWIGVSVTLESLAAGEVEERLGPYPWVDESWRLASFLEKRMAEDSWAWVGDEGRLVGARRRRLKELTPGLVEGLLKEAPMPEGVEECSVSVCEEGEPCTWLDYLRDPTPAWIRLALTR